jgi:hypothetical protein
MVFQFPGAIFAVTERTFKRVVVLLVYAFPGAINPPVYERISSQRTPTPRAYNDQL